ncbi:UNVERIFIED_CONTAM: hypothetical protein Slati_0409400 [Sesamum latifolium]|uniref:Uncharacterized protein n=1 Tax=Sesamum latifolium TaxID=2727402 RepID=A0AAW2XV20_9LAMI
MISSGVIAFDGVVMEESLLESTSSTDTDGGGGAVEDIASDGVGATHRDEEGVSRAIEKVEQAVG